MTDIAYGLIAYNASSALFPGNIGNEIQSLAVRQFLPRVDHIINFGELSSFRAEAGTRVKMVCNRWYAMSPEDWPPAPDIEPLSVSLHLSNDCSRYLHAEAGEFVGTPAAAEYMRQHGTIGTRDV